MLIYVLTLIRIKKKLNFLTNKLITFAN